MGRTTSPGSVDGSPLPVVAIVGRPNVGKSTLFNLLTRTRNALVADEPGMTRDRQYGRGVVGPRPYLVVDTGGLTEGSEGLDPLIARQAGLAMEEANAILFLVDGREGPNAADQAIADRLRCLGRAIYLVVNKTEGLNRDLAVNEFHDLGLGIPHPISSAHGQGVHGLMAQVAQDFPPPPEETGEETPRGLRIAVVGRPNVGKSTLINRMVGEERVLAFDQPGTTRDSIFVPFRRYGKDYILIDTAGLRRRARVAERVEKYSIIKTLQAIEAANVVILVVDAGEGVTDQDAHLLGHVLDSGRALVIAANKWDGLAPEQRQRVRKELERRFTFVDFARIHFISARHGTGVGDLFPSVHKAWEAADRKLSASRLTRLLEQAVNAHPPPLVRGRRIKLRYAHQGGTNPPVIVIHGGQAEALPDNYRRYLVRSYRKALNMEGTPIRLELKTNENPFKGRRNQLTPRQEARRRRLMKHVKQGR